MRISDWSSDVCSSDLIHMNVEARLKELVGEPAGRLHTARSRNDQVAVDFRLWVRDTLDRTDAGLRDLVDALLDQAAAHAGQVMPGFTPLPRPEERRVGKEGASTYRSRGSPND